MTLLSLGRVGYFSVSRDWLEARVWKRVFGIRWDAHTRVERAAFQLYWRGEGVGRHYYFFRRA
jgi:hypothetical protein